MDQLVMTGENFLKLLQQGGVISAAIGFCVAGYQVMWGGNEGPRKAKPWIFGAIAGLILVVGAAVFAGVIDSNIGF